MKSLTTSQQTADLLNTESMYTVTITGFRRHFHHIRRLVHFYSRQHGSSETEADIIERAVAEACHNALFHTDDQNESPSVIVELHADPTTIRILVKNHGPAFDFNGVKPFRPDQDFLVYKEGGLGIPIMKALMDEVGYEREENNLNVVTLIKHLNVKHRTGEVEHDENS
ncbi:MAG: ATP-binding protein [Calditrichota bacterium]